MHFSDHRKTTIIAATLVAVTIPLAAGPSSADDLPGSQAGVVPAAVAAPAVPARPTPEQLRAERERKAAALRKRLVVVARSKMRTARYVYGASGPRAFDCSGFTMWLYKTVAKRNLSHYSVAQMRQTKRVTKRNLLPGDLLFWGPGGSQHVSMYIGRGKMIGANNPRSGIRVESINAPWWRNKFAGAGRVIIA